MDEQQNKEVATIGGGCFWCLEPIFKDLRGVEEVLVGYSGGTFPDPSYEQVCTGQTGHAEVVQVTFDSDLISFREILDVFFNIHDPTTPNRQGADVGPQYRSIILYHNEDQKETAQRMVKEMEREKTWDKPIVTEIVPFEAFYRAEEYHQDYFSKNPRQAYCRLVVAPKILKFRKQFGSKLRRVD
jgi:peptide-methionine (S)-S-oxide reductase